MGTTMPTIDYALTEQIAMDWGPRILGALALLLVTHFLAKAAQWGLARFIDRPPGLKRVGVEPNPKDRAGYQLGQLAYWLVLLIGVIASLTVLGLTSIVTPLNAMLYEVTAYVPSLIGAVVIFFVGLVVATLARRVTEAALNVAHMDRWLERAGLSRMTGASGVAKALGALVFVVIIIPVAIASLQEMGISAISDPAVAVLATVLDALPRVLAAVLVLFIAFIIGRWVSGLIEQVLPSFGFDRSLQALGIGPQPEEEPTEAYDPPPSAFTPSKIVGRLAMVAIMLFSAVEAARLLAFSATAQMLSDMLQLAGHILFGGVIITIGVMVANFLAGLINNRGDEAHESFAAIIVRWATIALATAMGLRFMGIADEIVVLAFGLVLGSASVAAALAFGIGGRDAAAKLLEKWLHQAENRRPPPPVRRPTVRPPPRTPRL
jgi:hypothetical protein